MIFRADVFEHGGELVISVEMPGIDESTVEFAISRFVLTVVGQRQPVAGVRKGDYHRRERPIGNHKRDIALPFPVDDDMSEAASASLGSGVLTIRIPLAQRSLDSG